jgi:hypothetical protein
MLVLPALGWFVWNRAEGSSAEARASGVPRLEAREATAGEASETASAEGSFPDDVAYAVVCCSMEDGGCNYYSGTKCPGGTSQVGCPCRPLSE